MFIVLLSGFCVMLVFLFNQHVDKHPIVSSPPSHRSELQPPTYEISNPSPQFMGYHQILRQLNQWHTEAPEITQLLSYGKSSKGSSLVYFRITDGQPHPVVLITGSIHGNESWSTCEVMCLIGKILSQYGRNDMVTKLVNSRDLYFVPVISPDSYPNVRHVDGVDPNRDFPSLRDPNHRSTASVRAVQDLFLKIKPKAVIAGHTFGRVYIYPWGDQYKTSPNDEEYRRLLDNMGRYSGYRMLQGVYNYAEPMIGTELDWYYRHQAISIVMEIGTHQNPPNPEEISSEFGMIYMAMLYFIYQAPKIQAGYSISRTPDQAK